MLQLPEVFHCLELVCTRLILPSVLTRHMRSFIPHIYLNYLFLGIFQFQCYSCLRVFIAWGFLAHAFLSLPPKQVSEPIPRGGNTLELEQLDQKCTACFTLFCTLLTTSLSGTQVVEQVPRLFLHQDILPRTCDHCLCLNPPRMSAAPGKQPFAALLKKQNQDFFQLVCYKTMQQLQILLA